MHWTMHAQGRSGIEVKATTAWIFEVHDGIASRVTYFDSKADALEALDEWTTTR